MQKRKDMKIITTIILGVVISTTAMGQITREHQKHERFNTQEGMEAFKGSNSMDESYPGRLINARQPDITKSAKAIKQRLDERIIEAWNDINSRWVNSGKFEYTYDAGGNLTMQVSSNWKESASAWVLNLKGEFTFDENGFKVLDIYNKWNDTISQWIPLSKYEYTFDANGNMTLHSWYDWDVNTSRWVADRNLEYSYDASGNVTLEATFLWEKSTSQWVPLIKKEYTYNPNGQMTLEIWSNWTQSTGEWVFTNKYDNTYDANGNRTLRLWSRWEGHFNEWGGAIQKREYTYDLNGNPALQFIYYWTYSNRQWEGANKDEYAYDFTYGLSELIMPPLKKFIPDNSECIKNMPTDYIIYSYNSGTWVKDKKGTYYYSEIEILGVSEIEESDVKVFPNPASEFMVFDIDDSSTSATVELFDIQGRKVLSQQLSGNKQVSIRHLDKGLYVYNLNFNGRLYKGKIVVK